MKAERRFLPAMLVLIAGCGTGEPSRDVGTTNDVSTGDMGLDLTSVDDVFAEPDVADPGPIPPNADPCSRPDLWPLAVESSAIPAIVHYRPGESDEAREVLSLLEQSWARQVEELGFRPPPSDADYCGPDDRFDVFLWRGSEETYVDAIAENDATAWDDWIVYMVVDPWGPYGGDILDVTVAHELNHACQAADDWWEAPIAFEMTSVFVEDQVFGERDDWLTVLDDFQSRPDWSLDRDDGYETWYMYSAALYLHFLQERYFAGDASFVGRMWLRSQNPAGENEPDYQDALTSLLSDAGAGVDFVATVPEFARWRWSYSPEYPVALAADVAVDAGRIEVDPSPMMLGSSYVRVSSATASQFTLTFEGDPRVEWVVDALPDERLDVSAGAVTVDLADGERTIVATALPADGAHDPDDRDDTRYDVAMTIGP